jgi:hypothetical protein
MSSTEPTPGSHAAHVVMARRTLADFDAIVENGQWGALTPLEMGTWAGRLSEGLRDALAALDADGSTS